MFWNNNSKVISKLDSIIRMIQEIDFIMYQDNLNKNLNKDTMSVFKQSSEDDGISDRELLESINNRTSDILLGIESIEDNIPIDNKVSKLCDRLDKLDDNTLRLNNMTNELKGMVSMIRSNFQELIVLRDQINLAIKLMIDSGFNKPKKDKDKDGKVKKVKLKPPERKNDEQEEVLSKES